MELLNNTATAICSLLVLLGIANNPQSSGIDLPMVKKSNKDEEEPKW